MLVEPNDEDRAAVGHLFTVDEADAMAAAAARTLYGEEWYRLPPAFRLDMLALVQGIAARTLAHLRTRAP